MYHHFLLHACLAFRVAAMLLQCGNADDDIGPFITFSPVGWELRLCCCNSLQLQIVD
jgi:hypothetical protein